MAKSSFRRAAHRAEHGGLVGMGRAMRPADPFKRFRPKSEFCTQGRDLSYPNHLLQQLGLSLPEWFEPKRKCSVDLAIV